jgi:hypothetical protein
MHVSWGASTEELSDKEALKLLNRGEQITDVGDPHAAGRVNGVFDNATEEFSMVPGLSSLDETTTTTLTPEGPLRVFDPRQLGVTGSTINLRSKQQERYANDQISVKPGAAEFNRGGFGNWVKLRTPGSVPLFNSASDKKLVVSLTLQNGINSVGNPILDEGTTVTRQPLVVLDGRNGSPERQEVTVAQKPLNGRVPDEPVAQLVLEPGELSNPEVLLELSGFQFTHNVSMQVDFAYVPA